MPLQKLNMCVNKNEIVSIHKWLICPISVSGENFNPQNTACIPAVKIFAFLELEQIPSFMDGHELADSS
jgi:hypothetical protein